MVSRSAGVISGTTRVCRVTRRLPSHWRFIADVHDMGREARWFAASYDRSGWRPLEVPCVWDSLDESLRNYEGVAWCACEFTGARVPPDGQAWLRFGRVFYHCAAWLNGHHLGEHANGYAPFALECSTALRPGRNILVLRIDNRYSPERLPGGEVVEWVQYGGMWDPVVLDVAGPVRIESCAVDARPGTRSEAVVSWRVAIANRGSDAVGGLIRVRIADSRSHDTQQAFECPGRGNVTVEGSMVIPQVRLWSPETPQLYPFYAELWADSARWDRYTTRIGVRSLQVRDGRILLNGRPFYVKGVNRYEECGRYGPCPPKTLVKREFRMMKAAGVNLIRCHYPVSPTVIDCCDRYGILLMQETPINWWGTAAAGKRRAQTDAVLAPAMEVIDSITARDRNHPSFAIWSLANESRTDSRVGERVIAKLIAHARAVDPGRLVTFVVSQHCATHRMYARADIVAVNTYFGVFFGQKAQRLADLETRVRRPTATLLRKESRHFPEKAFIVGEYGCCAFAGMHGDAAYTEEFQAAYLRAVWDAIRSVPRVSGGILWAWADYRHRYSFALHVPYGPYGVVTTDRTPKLALQTLKKMYAEP